MPLSASSPALLHLAQNISLIALSSIFTPLCTFITLLSVLISPYTNIAKHIRRRRKWRADSSSTYRPRTVLVTGVGMSKGLAIARSFYQSGHTVIGADFEPHGVLACGRFSRALKNFYRLPSSSSKGAKGNAYTAALVKIIKEQNVELWVSCSGVACAVEDGEAAEAVERLTSCKAIQFGISITETLHEKHSFIENTKNLGLNVPDTHLVTAVEDATDILYPTPQSNEQRSTKKKYIMKSVGMDDSIRADLTLLPRPSPEETRRYILRLRPSSSRPFVLQQFITGSEFCTHSLILRGKVLVFTACESAELLMHYKALPSSSDISQALFKYTQIYAEKMGEAMTGHFSIDFLLDEKDSEKDLMKRIYPIECNPRAHTAVILFTDQAEVMADAYLSALPGYEPSANDGKAAIVMASTGLRYYWIGHDLVTRLILPFLGFLTLQNSFGFMLAKWRVFLEHVVELKDGTYEVWDPWPAWWLYCVYWPGMFLMSILYRDWWSRCNVSTAKMFRCK